MRDFSVEPVQCTVPVNQIVRSRLDFPTKRLTFEVLVETATPHDAFGLCQGLTNIGLAPRHVTYHATNGLFLRISDAPASDPAQIADLFQATDGARLLRWTTVIGG